MLGQFFGFQGRIGRGTWWMAQLFGLVLILLCIFAAVVTGKSAKPGSDDFGGPLALLFIVSYMLMIVVNICSSVKRYHDRGKSGWWMFVAFVPLIGGIWQLIELGFCSGDDGDNTYGPTPGSANRLESLNQEIGALKSATSSRLSKLDDNYIANYARDVATKQATQQMASTPSFATAGTAKPTFGKR